MKHQTMTIISPISDDTINEMIEEFHRIGGIEFKVFTISTDISGIDVHNLTAKTALLSIKEEEEQYFQRVAKENQTNRSQFFTMTANLEELEQSGQQITVREFLGPHFDLTVYKPIIRGQTNNQFLNSYFYSDEKESIENRLEFNEICSKFKRNEFDGTSIGFAGAFLEPPHSLRIGNTIFDKGTYFNQFCELLFSDLNKLEIYKWSVDCSNYFDAGKEWWGSHFWTIYNPTKNIYIGALASTTD
jgi:hypothetical protein